MNELLNLSGSSLAQKISKKEVSPTEVLEAHIRRIEEVNPALNAMVEDDFTRARKLAEEQTDLLASVSAEELPPLFGVPFTVKEMLSYEGMKRTGGNIHRRDTVMDWDASVLGRLRKAGAIPMGTTNVPEFGFWFETHNQVYGRTNNPYDVARTCGGSSGGEGALIGAGASPFGVGSDIGGSIRIPAFFCGVFGHKPSRYWIPLTGHFPHNREDMPLLRGDKYPFTSIGPIARKAEDLWVLTELMMGSDGVDQETLSDIRLQESLHDWRGKKVLICPSPVFHGTRKTDDELAQVVRNCGKLFDELGAHVEELDPRFFVRATELWFAALRNSKTKDFHQALIGDETSFSVGKELLNLAMGKGNYTFPNIMVSLIEILGLNNKNPSEELRALQKMKEDLDRLLGEDGILILPPHSRVAPKHRAVLFSPFDFIYTGIFVMLGHPATAVPTGLNPQGLPLGVQVVARHGQDHLTLSCADFLESTFGGWQPPQNL